MKRIIPSLLILTLTIPALAQNKSRIIGEVTTAEGLVIVGVKVTITSKELIGTSLTTKTNERGWYRFVLLPLGTYNIKFEKEGYETVEVKGRKLNFDSTLVVNRVLSPAAFEEVVVVTGEGPMVDKTKSSIGGKFATKFLRNLPNTRVIWTLPNALAGYTDSSAFGAPANSGNTYNIDGVNVSDPSTGTYFPSINMEATEQFEITMIGAHAEYGAFTGAALNVITKSGGNEFHGEVNYFFRSADWVSDNTGEYRDYGVTVPTATRLTDPNIAVGGPVLRDRLWFFFNYNYQKYETERELIDKAITQVEIPKRPFVKLTANWDNRNLTSASWTGYTRDRSHRAIYGSWRHNYEGSLWKQISEINTYLVQHSYVVNDSFILEGRLGGFRGGFDLVPRIPGPTRLDIILYRHLPPGSLSRTDLYTRNSESLLLTANYFNDDLKGRHSMKFGFEYGKALGARLYSHEQLQYYRRGTPYLWYDYGTFKGGTVLRRVGFFAQDSWSISDRLTLNFGFRFDSNGGSAEDPSIAPAGDETFFRFNDPAWRLGIAYDLFGDDKTVLRGFVGRYYEGVVRGNTESLVTVTPPTYRYFWTGSNWKLFDIAGGSRPGDYEIDSDLSNQYSDEFMLSVERELRPNMAGSITFVYKWDRNMIGIVYPNISWTDKQADFSNEHGSYSGPYYNRVLLGKPKYYTNPKKGIHGVEDNIYRRYWALVFDFNKRMSGRWGMKASYTYGHGTGTAPNHYGIITGWNTFNNPNLWINAVGRLTFDRPHALKCSLSYMAPFEIFVTPHLSFLSGLPHPLQFQPEDIVVGDELVRIKPMDGKERFDSQFNIDLRLEKSFSFGDGYRFGILFDVFNLLNDDAVTGYKTTAINLPTFKYPSKLVSPRSYQLGFRFLF